MKPLHMSRLHIWNQFLNTLFVLDKDNLAILDKLTIFPQALL